ncbi:MAG: response regulator transcription factor [Anaerolineaceae bacterium]|nr:response regulator transcription factor [Anaerolineaceae bacterium]
MESLILIVDDEPQISAVISAYLTNSGYRTITAQDGKTALELFEEKHPALVLLDLNLPGKDGLEVCQTIRQDSDTPIIMLTARSEETDKLVGLELGADDYIVKPFSPREVVARVKTVLRRSGSGAETQVIKTDRLEIDTTQHIVLRDGQLVELTPTEFDLLLILAQNPRRVFSRLQLLEKTQGTTYEGYERTIDAHIKNLRLKLEPDPRNPSLIHTVFGVGYKYEEIPDA